MTPDLPAPLRMALEQELAGVSRRALADRAAATSQAYRAGRGSSGVILGRDDALAYALTRLPATYAACAAVLSELQDRAPSFAPASLLDAGCGPGGGTWAVREAYGGVAEIAWIDASGPFLDLGLALGQESFAPTVQRGDLATVQPPPADLVLVSYALAELTPAQQAQTVERLWTATAGVLLVVEPGTPAGHDRILAARQALIAAGARILAPCPHAGVCPLAPPDWCHASVRLARSRDHKAAKGVDLPYEDEKYAYLIAARPGVGGSPTAARVLGPPRSGKPGIELRLCTASGLEARFVARREKAAHAVARRLEWGDAIPDAIMGGGDDRPS
jgi:ribosomal protein RSM22 (predicted rRNA methylase)